MFRILVLLVWLLPLRLSAQQIDPSSPPDYKALYEQANDAAARWKAQAEQLQKDNNQLRDQIALSAPRSEPDPVRAAAETRRSQEAAEQARLQSAPKIAVAGKVLSVTSFGVLISCDKAASTPDGLCFVETRSKGLLDGAQVLFSTMLLPRPYVYQSAGGGTRTVPRYRDAAPTL